MVSGAGKCDTDSDLAPCRRRKIRCVLRDGNSQQRCCNCIRLNKDCVFHPPDRQYSVTGRFRSSDKVGRGSETSAANSPSSSERNTRRLSYDAEHLQSFSSFGSNAAPGSQGLSTGPGNTLSNNLACGMSEFEIDTMLPFGFQQTLADCRAPWKQSNCLFLSSRGTMSQVDGYSLSDGWSNPMVPLGDCAPFPNADTATRPPLHHIMSTTNHSTMIPFGQAYPSTFLDTGARLHFFYYGQTGVPETVAFEKYFSSETRPRRVGFRGW